MIDTDIGELECPYCGAIQDLHTYDEPFSADMCYMNCEECDRGFYYSVRVERQYSSFNMDDLEETDD